MAKKVGKVKDSDHQDKEWKKAWVERQEELLVTFNDAEYCLKICFLFIIDLYLKEPTLPDYKSIRVI